MPSEAIFVKGHLMHSIFITSIILGRSLTSVILTSIRFYPQFYSSFVQIAIFREDHHTYLPQRLLYMVATLAGKAGKGLYFHFGLEKLEKHISYENVAWKSFKLFSRSIFPLYRQTSKFWK